MIRFKHLEWDSNFFTFKVAKINSNIYSNELIRLLEKLKIQGYTLIYLFTEQEIDASNSMLKKYNGILVDKKITFNKVLDQYPNKEKSIVVKYNSNFIDKNLLELAIQSGEFSRFKVDNQIDNKKFEELYNIWMINSIQKKIAKEVFVYKENKILGFVSVGEKKGRADIGLIAVDHSGRGKGIGSKLIYSAENWAIDQNYKEIQVITQGDNIKACQFYKKCNYNEEKTEFIYHLWLK